jgi:hydroxymethylglutaryl-CoA lyase
MDIGIISLADTVGLASADQVYDMTKYLVDSLPGVEVGVHLHSTAQNWKEKLEAAVKAGSKRFDGAIKGIGGCPMAGDDLVGNMQTELMISYFEEHKLLEGLDKDALINSISLANEIFI